MQWSISNCIGVNHVIVGTFSTSLWQPACYYLRVWVSLGIIIFISIWLPPSRALLSWSLDSCSLQWAVICCWEAFSTCHRLQAFDHVYSVRSHHCCFKGCRWVVRPKRLWDLTALVELGSSINSTESISEKRGESILKWYCHIHHLLQWVHAVQFSTLWSGSHSQRQWLW